MLNITKVNSQIRNSGHLFWYRKKQKDYISNGYWVIIMDLRDAKYKKVLGVLVERFGSICRNNKELQLFPTSKEEVLKTNTGDPYWFHLIEEIGHKLVDTGLKQKIDYKNEFMNVFKGESYVYINEKYLQMVNKEHFFTGKQCRSYWK